MQIDEFDLSRAVLTKGRRHLPYMVSETVALSQALADGTMAGDRPLLVMADEAGVLACSTLGLSTYKVMQGERAGQPWMVTF